MEHSPGISNETASLVESYLANNPDPAPESAPVQDAESLFSGTEDAFASMPESAPQVVADVPPPSAPTPTPAPVPQQPAFDVQAFLAEQARQAAEERRAFMQTLQQFAPKPAPQPEVEPDYMAMLPPEMRHPDNLPTAKVMYQIAQKQAAELDAKYQKQAEQARFEAEVERARYEGQQVAQRLAARGYDFNAPGAQIAQEGVSVMARALAAANGNSPAAWEAKVHEYIEAGVKARLAGITAQNKARLAQQAPAARVPAMAGAPAMAASQVPGAASKIPTDAEAVAMGFKGGVTEWYLKNR
jgi:hypothetical protein